MNVIMLTLLGMYLFFGVCITHAGYRYRKEKGTMSIKYGFIMIIWPFLYFPISIYRVILDGVKNAYEENEEDNY